MSLLQGFATVNREEGAAQAAGGHQPGQTLEAQEQRAIAAYERSLSLIHERNELEAEAALRSLLVEPVVEQSATDQLHRIKFLALKNLGDLLARRAGGVPDALSAYCQATEVVDDDALLWNKLGTLAAEAGYWAAARTAFERGLELDPQHPTMHDKLLSLLAHTGDANAAATLAAALLRQNPRHAGAAAMLAAQRRGDPEAAAAGAGLLQLAPMALPAGGLARHTIKQYTWDRERPRTLEQPTWQQLLHHSLLFLSANRLAEGGQSTASASAAAASSSATASPGVVERKAVHSLVRFNYKRPQQAQPQSQQPDAAAAAATAAGGNAAVSAAAAEAQQQGAAQPEAAAGAADVAPMEVEAPQGGGVQEAVVAVPRECSPVAAAAEQSPVPPAVQQTPTAAEHLLAPAEAGSSSATPPDAGEAQCVPEALLAGADEEQEQRHPNGRASMGRVEARATRSRAATGKAALPLAPATAGGAQQLPEEEALELLGELGQLLCLPQQPAAAAPAVASPLLSSPAKAGREIGSSEQQAAQQQQRQQEEEEAVKSFIRQLPSQGVGRHELAQLLLRTLGTASSAAQLTPPVRLQLLQVVYQVQHDGLLLQPELCLVLGELFSDAAAVAARGGQQQASAGPAAASSSLTAAAVAAAAASRGGASTAAAPAPRQASSIARRPSAFRNRRGELTPAMMQQSARIWLSRFRLAATEDGQGPDGSASTEQAAQVLSGMARYWWATGRLLESSGDMPTASVAYANCGDCLKLQGSGTILLPHCQADGCISLASMHAKQEALQLHTVLEAASQSALGGDQAAVVSALAPVLLCCTDKEQQMLQLDQEQWERGLQMLLTAATAVGSWALVLRCHLRLLNALLPPVPEQLVPYVQNKEEVAACSEAGAALNAVAEQLAVQSLVRGALDAAAEFLQQHKADLSLVVPNGSSTGRAPEQQQQQQVVLHPMERAMYEEVQHQLAAAVAGCCASLAAAGPAAAESSLNLKANAKRGAMCDAATALLYLDSLAASGSPPRVAGVAGAAELEAVERSQNIVWQLCDALGTVQALMERHGRFVKTCLSELRALLRRLDALGPAPADGRASAGPSSERGAEDGPDAQELRTQLTGGMQHCLYWLFGLELPGLDKQEEWGGDFQVKGSVGEAAARQLTSQQAVADVWPLVEPYLLQDVQHVAKHKAFLLAAAEPFNQVPPAVAARCEAAWQRLAAAEPPHLLSSELDGDVPNPMQRLLQLASQAASARPGAGQEAAQPMMLDGEAAAEAELAQERDGQPSFHHVRRSLYFLLSQLQAAEGSPIDSLLAEDADAVLERQLQATKADLFYNPGRCASWEKLAADYHDAADGLLGKAATIVTHRQWRHDRDLRNRVRQWRQLAYWASAGTWLSVTTTEERVQLLAMTGDRLLGDVLRELPEQDPLASKQAWQAVKAGSTYGESCRLAAEAFDAAEAALESQDDSATWQMLVARARCLRKQQQPVVNWLPLMARACHYASDDGGVLYPLYALHASRMRLLLAMPSAARWARGNGGDSGKQVGRSSRRGNQRGQQQQQQQQDVEEECELLRLVGSYCFLPSSNTSMRSPGQKARVLAAEAAEAERREDWQGLLEDCCAAMRWCLEKGKNFHRAAYRLADAMHRTSRPHEAVAVLAPLFSRARQVFAQVMMPIQEEKVDSAGKRGRKAQRGSQEQQSEAGEGGDAVPECNWGEPPARLSHVGMEEGDAAFNTRLRKTLRLYFACLSDAAFAEASGQPLEAESGRPSPLEALQAAATVISSLPPETTSKAWDGLDKLARGHYLLALIACLDTCCPLTQLQAAQGPPAPSPCPPSCAGAESESQQQLRQQQTPGASLAGAASGHAALPSTAPASAPATASALQATPAEAAAAARGLFPVLPTPATQARQQHSALLLQQAALLDGSKVEPLLARAHQVFTEFSVHCEGDENKWRSVVAPSVVEALSNSSSSTAVADKRLQHPDVLRSMFSLYATLYVHLLQHLGAADKLLGLLQAMKKRVRFAAGAEPKQARFLRRQALGLSEALLGAVQGALSEAEHEVGALVSPGPQRTAVQAAPAPMEVEVQGAGPAAGTAPAEQEAQQQAGQPQEQASPPPVKGLPADASVQGSPAAADLAEQRLPSAQTPAAASVGGASRGATPGTDLRAVLGTPGSLPLAEQQQVQERSVALLQVAHSFQREIARWLQALGAAASGSGGGAREELRAVGTTGEEMVLRAYRLHARCTGQPTMLELSRLSRAEQLKAAEDVAKQQRRQSRQQGAGARQQQQQQQQQQQGANVAAAAGAALQPIAEDREEQPAPAGRKRVAAAPSEAPQSTRKRSRHGSVPPQQQEEQPQVSQQEGAEQMDKQDSPAVQEAVAEALEAAVAGAAQQAAA